MGSGKGILVNAGRIGVVIRCVTKEGEPHALQLRSSLLNHHKMRIVPIEILDRCGAEECTALNRAVELFTSRPYIPLLIWALWSKGCI
jgi:hypothetical protein